MNATPQTTTPASSTTMMYEVIVKRRTQSAITEESDEEEENASLDSCAENFNRRPETATSCTTAGLFIHNPFEKPLPLSFQRTIPIPRFWKRSIRHSMPTTSAPDILRRTGEMSAKFAQETNNIQSSSCFQKGNEWVCRHCNHGNTSTVSCALCGQLHEHFSVAPSCTPPTTNESGAASERSSGRRSAVRRSYSAHISSTRERQPQNAYGRSRSMSESDEL